MEIQSPESRISLPTTDFTLRFVDTETGGFSPTKNSLLTVGILTYRPSEKIPEEIELAISQDEYFVTTKAMEINGLDLNVLKSTGTTPADTASRMSQVFQEDTVYIGHNVGFDFDFMSHFMERSGYPAPNFRRNHIDTKAMALNRMVNKRLPKMSTSLENLCVYFGIDAKGNHNALKDCYLTAALYSELLKV